MSFFSVLKQDKNQDDIELEDIFSLILMEVEGVKGNMHLSTIFEYISDKLKQHNINSVICIINEKRNEIVVRHVNLPKEFKNIFTTPNIKKISFENFPKYQESIKNKTSVFSQNRFSQLKRIFKDLKKLEIKDEMNSIISPLILRNETIGTLEILSQNIKKEDKEKVDNFVKKLVISITNQILFHEIRESETRYRELFNNSSDALVFFDTREKRFKESNKSMTKISAYTADELKQLNYLNLFFDKDKKTIKEKIAKAKNAKQNVKFFWKNKN